MIHHPAIDCQGEFRARLAHQEPCEGGSVFASESLVGDEEIGSAARDGQPKMDFPTKLSSSILSQRPKSSQPTYRHVFILVNDNSIIGIEHTIKPGRFAPWER